MHAALVGVTKKNAQSETIQCQTVTTNPATGNQRAVLQNRGASSDPRGAQGEPPPDAIDPAESSAPTVKAVNPPLQAVLHFHQRLKAGASGDVEMLLQQLPALSTAIDMQTGLTPLCIAAMHGYTAMATLLLAAGAPVDGRERQGSTALMCAAQAGQAGMIRLLLKQGADVNAVNQQMARSVLVGAVNEKHLEVCKVLIEAGADIQSTMTAGSGTGQTASPLDVAIVQGWTALLQWLLQSKRLSLESEIARGTTLLNFACFTGSLESVKFLLDAGADATTKYDQVTGILHGPLWYADINEQFHVVEYLLNRGISVPLNLPALPIPGRGFIYHPAADSTSSAGQRDRTPHVRQSVLKDALLVQSPQKLIEGLADKKIDLFPIEKKWTQWFSELGMSSVITHEMFKLIGNAAVVFRALAGNYASTSREQYLQALTHLVEEACMSPSLNAPFAKFNMTERGETHMNQLVYRQRVLLLQGVTILREQQLQRLKTLADVCFNAYISTSHQLHEAGLYRFLTRRWGLYDPAALAVIRVIKAAHQQVLRSPVNVPLRTALTSLLDGLSESSYLPEFAEALQNLGTHVNKRMYGELIFSQWRMVNDAYQVTIKRPPLMDAAQ